VFEAKVPVEVGGVMFVDNEAGHDFRQSKCVRDTNRRSYRYHYKFHLLAFLDR
jgi:hypothetical protein